MSTPLLPLYNYIHGVGSLSVTIDLHSWVKVMLRLRNGVWRRPLWWKFSLISLHFKHFAHPRVFFPLPFNFSENFIFMCTSFLEVREYIYFVCFSLHIIYNLALPASVLFGVYEDDFCWWLWPCAHKSMWGSGLRRATVLWMELYKSCSSKEAFPDEKLMVHMSFEPMFLYYLKKFLFHHFYIYLHAYTLFAHSPPRIAPLPHFQAEPLPPSSPILLKRKHKR
jgi:hypothetical protein